MWNVPGPQVGSRLYAVPIEHDDGLFLFDTEIRPQAHERRVAVRAPEQTPEQTIPAQLELAGFAVSDVTTLVNSAPALRPRRGQQALRREERRARAELAQARNHEPFEFFGYSDKTWDYEGASFEPVSGDSTGHGAMALRDPGHTIGHYSLLVKPERRRRPMLFAFDVVYTQPAFERASSRFHIDPRGGVRSIARVKEVAAEHGADIYFSTTRRPSRRTSTHRILRALGGTMGKLDDRWRSSPARHRASARRSWTSWRTRAQPSS
jgi:4-pyridoxolactonase